MYSPPKLERALESLRQGRFVLVYDADGREEETDFVIGAQFVQPEHVMRMRRDGGGLIFLMVHHSIGHRLGLPFLTDVLAQGAAQWPVLAELTPDDIPYDTKSSFSIAINHRDTFTGVTDQDRALTMREFALLMAEVEDATGEEARKLLGQRFRSPGHVPLCLASDHLLATRQGHTELSVALGVMAGITPVMAGCEMMDVGRSLPKEDARDYARRHHLVFLEGAEIVEAWKKWSE
ncbi:MAG: 3,4-dihydroxy-2-butanone-4-phosphate synthase [Candidatus Thermoplasmatota archaeon]|nr:3,4-dihydroxy-2-butanone-4-phosphate synthase [Candidatus Thermoplasmatota archaeon]